MSVYYSSGAAKNDSTDGGKTSTDDDKSNASTDDDKSNASTGDDKPKNGDDMEQDEMTIDNNYCKCACS